MIVEGRHFFVSLSKANTVADIVRRALTLAGQISRRAVHVEWIATRTGEAMSLNMDTKPMPTTISAGLTVERRH